MNSDRIRILQLLLLGLFDSAGSVYSSIPARIKLFTSSMNLPSIPFSHLAQLRPLTYDLPKGWSLGGLRSQRYRAASLQLLAQRKTRIVQEDELVRGPDSLRGLHYLSVQSLVIFLSADSLLLLNKDGSLITDCSPLFESLQWSLTSPTLLNLMFGLGICFRSRSGSCLPP